MQDFYANSARMPLDQADGLRRLFAGRRRHLLALAANPHVAFSGAVLDRLAAVLAAQGRQVLVVDAGAASPPPHELAGVDLAACIETIAPRVAYLPARGLPMTYVDTRGSAAGFIDAVHQAMPQAEIVLLHAEGMDLARVLKHRAARPLLLGADHPESIKHAYANAKLLVQRCGLMTFDLLLTAAPQSPRAADIAASLGGCADRFLDAVLRHWARIDPAGDPAAPPDAALAALLAAQLALDDGTPPSPFFGHNPAGHIPA
jgi:flagellar biosynthesis protein FlhG